MDENKLYKSLIICVLVLASLALYTFVPRISVAGFELKRVDLFADIRNNSHKRESKLPPNDDQPGAFDLTYLPYFKGFTHYLTASDGISPLLAIHHFAVADEKLNKRLVCRYRDSTLVKIKSVAELPVSSALFEDFSPESRSLHSFFRAMNAIKPGEGKGRIAFFGDSFIEGDIFCADVRNLLQDQFGGNGVGFVPITSEVAQFRNTIGHSFTGFRSHSIVKKEMQYEPYGAGGYCFTAGKENDVTYSVNPKFKHLNL